MWSSTRNQSAWYIIQVLNYCKIKFKVVFLCHFNQNDRRYHCLSSFCRKFSWEPSWICKLAITKTRNAFICVGLVNKESGTRLFFPFHFAKVYSNTHTHEIFAYIFTFEAHKLWRRLWLSLYGKLCITWSHKLWRFVAHGARDITNMQAKRSEQNGGCVF